MLPPAKKCYQPKAALCLNRTRWSWKPAHKVCWRTLTAAAAQSRESVALLLMREGGGMSLCRPSRLYVSWPGVRRQMDRLPSCMPHRTHVCPVHYLDSHT